jgi:hypothetical protein
VAAAVTGGATSVALFTSSSAVQGSKNSKGCWYAQTTGKSWDDKIFITSYTSD